MSQIRLIEAIKKFPTQFKKGGVFPIFLLILIFLGVASMGNLPVKPGQQNRASGFSFPGLEPTQSAVAAIPLQLKGDHPVTQTAGPVESTPELIPADTMLFLEDRQFACKELQDRADLYHWDCTRTGKATEFDVGIFMKSLEAVYLVDANVRQSGIPDGAVVVELFSMFADLPGLRVDREEVRAWLAEAVRAVFLDGSMQTETMDGIRFRVYGGKEDCSLEIEIPQ